MCVTLLLHVYNWEFVCLLSHFYKAVYLSQFQCYFDNDSFLPFGFLLVVIILKSKKIYKTPNSCITSFVTRLFLLFQNLLCTSISLSLRRRRMANWRHRHLMFESLWPTEDINIWSLNHFGQLKTYIFDVWIPLANWRHRYLMSGWVQDRYLNVTPTSCLKTEVSNVNLTGRLQMVTIPYLRPLRGITTM